MSQFGIGTMKRARRASALAAALALGLAACGGGGGGGSDSDSGSGSGEKVTLNYWVYESTDPNSTSNAIADAFEKAHPNIEIKETQFPYQNYDVKVQTAIAAGKAPDLVYAFNLDLMRRGELMPLDDMVKKYKIDIANFNQAIIKGPGQFSCSLDGTLYCLGSTQGGWSMFYNKDMFDAAGIPYPKAWPPMTLDQFADIACQLTDKSKNVWGAAAPTDYLPRDLEISPDGKTVEGYIDSSATIHDFQVLADMYKNGCSPTSNVIDPWDQSANYFEKGNLAMAMMDLDSAKAVEHAGINYGITGPPTPPGIEPYFDVYSNNTGIIATTDHPEEAQEFLAFIVSPEGQKIAFETEGATPIDNKVAKDVNWAQGKPGREDALEILSHSRSGIFVPDTGNTWGPFYDAWGYILSGDKSVEQAMTDAAPAIQQNVDKAWRDWDDYDSGG
jgi:multiple sugar transport system substrate-binding protein